MFKKLTLALCLVLTAFLGFVGMQPAEFQVSRELVIQATADDLFPYINNSKLANSWMPWTESDPGVQMIYSGPEEGVGATTSWASKGKMGTGEAKVVEVVPFQAVQTRLTYTEPMQMTQLAEISLWPQDGATKVRWSVRGENSFVGRIFCLFMNMDKMVGGEFEKGLNNLKKIVEAKK